MSKIENLKNLKNKILDKMITKESVSEYKESLILKGSYFKQFFKYIFLKKFIFKNDTKQTAIDLFFSDGSKYNIPKVHGAIILGLIGLSTLIDFTFISFIVPFVLFFSTYIIIYLSSYPSIWIEKNRKVNEKFNPENLAKIKETILKNYDEEDIKQLFKEGLTKEELIDIFKEIEELVGEDYFLIVFKSLNLHKQEKDISDPYILLLVINEIIDTIEKKTETDCENNKMEKNQKIMQSLLKENKEKEKTCEYLKVN